MHTIPTDLLGDLVPNADVNLYVSPDTLTMHSTRLSHDQVTEKRHVCHQICPNLVQSQNGPLRCVFPNPVHDPRPDVTNEDLIVRPGEE